MLLFIPVTSADYHLAGSLFRWMEALGGFADRHAVVLAFAATGVPSADRDHIIRCAERLGTRVAVTEMPSFPEYGWPRSPNLIFQFAAAYCLEHRAYGEPCWYFFELDNTPLCEGWLDLLADEYTFRGRPFMGAVNKTWRTKKGGHQYQDGEHMVGTGMYPVDAFQRVRVMKHLHLLTDPFDVAIQWIAVPDCWATTRILHNWATANYVLGEDGRVTCGPSDTRPTSKDYAQSFSFGSIGRELLVVHGCKDGSLVRLLKKQHALAQDASFQARREAEQTNEVLPVDAPTQEEIDAVRRPVSRSRSRTQPQARVQES